MNAFSGPQFVQRSVPFAVVWTIRWPVASTRRGSEVLAQARRRHDAAGRVDRGRVGIGSDDELDRADRHRDRRDDDARRGQDEVAEERHDQQDDDDDRGRRGEAAREPRPLVAPGTIGIVAAPDLARVSEGPGEVGEGVASAAASPAASSWRWPSRRPREPRARRSAARAGSTRRAPRPDRATRGSRRARLPRRLRPRPRPRLRQHPRRGRRPVFEVEGSTGVSRGRLGRPASAAGRSRPRTRATEAKTGRPADAASARAAGVGGDDRRAAGCRSSASRASSRKLIREVASREPGGRTSATRVAVDGPDPGGGAT